MAPTSSRPKITSSSFGLSTTGEKLGGKKTTIKISSLEKSSLKNLVSINNTLDSILNTLTGAQKEDKKLIDKQRKEEESKKRSEREKGLESKVFDGIKTAVSTVMKPFTSIWDWITNFFFNVFLGKVVIKLLNWFSDPKNKDKIQSIVRFFKDWWPTMLGAYILFGTSFGRLARGLVGVAGKAVIGLGKVLARLILSVTKGKALKAAGALSGGGGVPGRGGGRGLGGALLRGGLLLGGSLLAGAAIDKGVESFTGGGEEDQQAQIDVPDSPEIPMLNAATGGLADIGKIFGKFGGNMMGGVMGGMFGPLGMLMGSMMGGNLPNIFQGLVSGKKGTDKIPAMLTDGEFVMSKGAVQKYGVDTLESMNAAGGGTNIPKIVKGVPHAAGGGYIGDMGSNTMGEGASPFSVSKDQFKNAQGVELASRVKRIEEQVKIQNALATGKGIQTVAGTGHGTTYGGRQSILVKGGTQKLGAGTGYNAVTVPEINVGGMRYFAQQRGQDIIYTSNFAKGLSGQVDKYGARNKGYSGGGGGMMGGMSEEDKKNLPKTKIMMGPDGPFVGYLSYKNGEPTYQRPKQRNKGMLESMADFFDPKGAKGRQETLNARTMRLTAISDLEDMRKRGMKEENIKKMMNERLGANGYSRASNDAEAKKARINKEASQKNLDRLSAQGAGPRSGMGIRYRTEAAERNKDFDKRGGLLGQMGRGFTRMFGSGDQISKLDKEDRAANIKIKQSGAASIGRYYSTSDGKYYKDYKTAKLAHEQRKKSGVKPPVKPKPKYNPAGGGMNGARGGRSGSRPAGNVPSVKPTSNSSQSKQSARQKGMLGGK